MDVIKELEEVRSELTEINRDLVRKTAGEEKGPMPVPQGIDPNMPKHKMKVVKTPEALFKSIQEDIKTVADANNARLYWKAINLLQFSTEERTVICTALLQKFKEMGLEPQETWERVIKDPKFFDEWAAEEYEHTIPQESLNIQEASESSIPATPVEGGDL